MTKTSWRARIREGAISFLALATLVSILYIFDFRVREGATHFVSAASGSNAAQAPKKFTADASRVVHTAREQMMQHTAITGFVATAGVLLLFMLKT